MKRLIVVVILFVLFQCKPSVKNEGESMPGDSLTVTTDSTGFHPEYQKALDQLPNESASLKKGLELYKRQFQSSDAGVNDNSLKTYLDFHSTILEVLNNKFMSRPDYDRINNWYNQDSLQHTGEGKILMQELADNGIALESAEGQCYLRIGPAQARTYFYESLTPASKVFFDEFEKEEDNMDSDDGGLIISVAEVAERLGVWETYKVTYPDGIFMDRANAMIRYYLRVLLSGLDNTPAFGFEDQKLTQEFLDAYQQYLGKYQNTLAAKIIKDYMAILSTTAMSKSAESEAFVEKQFSEAD